MKVFSSWIGAAVLASSVGWWSSALAAQSAPSPAPPAAVPATPSQAPAPASQGTVIFQSHGEPPAAAAEPVDPNRKPLPVPQPPVSDQETGPASAPGSADGPELTDRERGALLFTAYDLDARMVPGRAGLTMRARVTVQNTSDTPLRRIALQVSSSLTWEGVSVAAPTGSQRLPLAQHLLDTDADHTGKASEALLELPTPLEPGGSLILDTFYSGTIAPSAERLLRIGASETQGAAADWDAIGTTGVDLRGFGNVLWYPVSAPQLFLGDGTRLFDAVDRTRLQEQATSVRLRLSVDYIGDPPTAAYFCGRRAAFTALSDAPDAPTAPTATGTGVATAEFAAEPLGFRLPSLFVIARSEVLAGHLQGELAGGEPMLAVETQDGAVLPALGDAAERVAPLLQQWLGARPLSALTVLDHAGQPFQDGPLLVAPITALTTSEAEPALTASLSQAWMQTGRPWVDDGVAQFFVLLQVEQARGREAMVAQLGEMLRPLAHAGASAASGAAAGSASSLTSSEAAPAPAPPEPLIAAGSELYFGRKAAAVWLMLRGIVGDQALQFTLQTWRLREPIATGPRPTAEQDALAIEALLEKNSGKDLHRFFEDWVLHDRGLPDLTVAEVTPRQLPTPGTEHTGNRDPGWLTVVTVTNAGGAVADVPLIVSSGSFSTTLRLVIPGNGSATARVQTESAPTAVQVNDGITPEARTSVHRRELRIR